VTEYFHCRDHGNYNPTTGDSNCPECKKQFEVYRSIRVRPTPLFNTVEIPDEYEKLAKIAICAEKVFVSFKAWAMFEVHEGETHDLLKELKVALQDGGYLDGVEGG